MAGENSQTTTTPEQNADEGNQAETDLINQGGSAEDAGGGGQAPSGGDGDGGEELTLDEIDAVLATLPMKDLKQLKSVQKYGDSRANTAVRTFKTKASATVQKGKDEPPKGGEPAKAGETDPAVLAELERLRADKAAYENRFEEMFTEGLEALPPEALERFPLLVDESVSLDVRTRLLQSVQAEVNAATPTKSVIGKKTRRELPKAGQNSGNADDQGDGGGDEDGGDGDQKPKAGEAGKAMLEKRLKKTQRSQGYNPWGDQS